MLGKLIKHEFRATGRIMPLIYLIVLSVAVAAHFAAGLLDRGDLPLVLDILLSLVIPLFIAALTAVFVVYVVVTVARFKRNVLGDEGYLTMTLPVSIHSIIWAKIIVSVVWFVCAVIVDFLALAILFFDNNALINTFTDLGKMVSALTGEELSTFISMGAELLAVCLVQIIAQCLIFYAALSIGHGFSKGKMGFSFLFYFVLSSASSIIGIILMVVFSESLFTPTAGSAITHGLGVALPDWHILMAIIGGINLVEAAVYYIITWLNLKNRLNLE